MNKLSMLIAGLLLTLTIACKSKTTAVAEDTMDKAETKRSPRNQNGRQGPRSVDEVFKMDKNNDGLLSKDEVSGRLLDNFLSLIHI